MYKFIGCYTKELFDLLIILLLSIVGFQFFTNFILELGLSGYYVRFSIIIIEIFISILTVILFILRLFNKGSLYKICNVFIILIDVIAILLFFLKKFGMLDKFSSINDLKDYVLSFDNFAVIIYVFLQFAQVVILPIPSFITVGAGVLLFGPLKAAVFSVIGIILGSIVAFLLGRIFGYKLASFIIGKKNIDKTLSIIKNKDKLILTFMFLFPFFPDDALCFVAGLSSMSVGFFIVMIIITRLISVFASCYSINNNLIPYDTWWGIIIWCLFFTFCIFASIFICKKGHKLQNKILNKNTNKIKGK